MDNVMHDRLAALRLKLAMARHKAHVPACPQDVVDEAYRTGKEALVMAIGLALGDALIDCPYMASKILKEAVEICEEIDMIRNPNFSEYNGRY